MCIGLAIALEKLPPTNLQRVNKRVSYHTFSFFFLLFSVDVLVSELNFGAASRWVEAAERVPVPSRPSSEKPPDTNLNNRSDSDSDSYSNFHPL